jgi:hypothetical protein
VGDPTLALQARQSDAVRLQCCGAASAAVVPGGLLQAGMEA